MTLILYSPRILGCERVCCGRKIHWGRQWECVDMMNDCSPLVPLSKANRPTNWFSPVMNRLYPVTAHWQVKYVNEARSLAEINGNEALYGLWKIPQIGTHFRKVFFLLFIFVRASGRFQYIRDLLVFCDLNWKWLFTELALNYLLLESILRDLKSHLLFLRYHQEALNRTWNNVETRHAHLAT